MTEKKSYIDKYLQNFYIDTLIDSIFFSLLGKQVSHTRRQHIVDSIIYFLEQNLTEEEFLDLVSVLKYEQFWNKWKELLPKLWYFLELWIYDLEVKSHTEQIKSQKVQKKNLWDKVKSIF